MDPVWVVLIGVAMVFVSVLALRLHAFLALLLSALTVAMLTTPSMLQNYSALEIGLPASREAADSSRWTIDLKGKSLPQATSHLLLIEKQPDQSWKPVGQIELKERTADRLLGVGEVATSDNQLPLRTVEPVAWEKTQKDSKKLFPERVAISLGSTCGKIAILIALAAIVGKCLLETGAADRIVRSAVSLVGQKRASVAFITSGFLLSIPVYFDTVFYLMIPLAKSLRIRTGRDYLLYVLSLIVGGTMAHSLIPPTPGPLIVVEQFDIPVGLMIIAGTCVCVFTSIAGYLYSITANRYWELPLRETPDMRINDIAKIASREDADLPPLWVSLLPIVLPVVLIASLFTLEIAGLKNDSVYWKILSIVGDKNVAMLIAAGIGLCILAWQTQGDRKHLADSVSSALATGGIIILITAAGGAFGAMLRETGVTEMLTGLQSSSPLVVLLIAYFLTMIIRTVQGSATVAMITAAGVLSSVATSEALGFHPVYLALAVGCGSKPIMWMNDSGFWTICKMSGMTEVEGLKSITPMILFISLVGLAVTVVGAILFPMV